MDAKHNEAIGILIVLGGVFLIGYLLLILFRVVVRRLGFAKMLEDGYELDEEGIKLPRLFFMGKQTFKYERVANIKIFSRRRDYVIYGLKNPMGSPLRFETLFFADKVLIFFKRNTGYTTHLVITPKNTEEFVKELEKRTKLKLR